jgi:hypothetical protein
MKKVVLAVLTVACAGCDQIPPAAATQSAMVESFARINIYAETNRSVPPSLDVLPRRAGYANQTTDGWGRPLQYDLSQDGIITLRSLGADGKPGGVGENADVSLSYFSKRPDGSLWVGSPMWIGEAVVRPQQDGPANRSQPGSSETNPASGAAGSGR